MLPPWGLILTRPGETAMSAGAMLRPCGLTFTPTGDTEMRVCMHTDPGEAITLKQNSQLWASNNDRIALC